jgi:hypothetical protein
VTSNPWEGWVPSPTPNAGTPGAAGPPAQIEPVPVQAPPPSDPPTVPADGYAHAAFAERGQPVLPAPPPAGPCDWPADMSCDPKWANYSAAVQQRALSLATEVLWAFTGHRFGLCPVTVRPCRQPIRCRWSGWSGYGWNAGAYQSGSVLQPYVLDGLWRNGCGGCGSECGCNQQCVIRLSGPLYAVTQVMTGGAVVPDTAWVVYNGTTTPLLVRTDDECWMHCQNMTQPDDGADALAVTYLKGTPVPNTGRAACGILASEIAKACVGASGCRLPTRVSQVVREGMTLSFIDPLSLYQQGRTGIPEVDMWIAAVNPQGVVRPGAIFSPDVNRGRQVTQSNPHPWQSG